ncbi:MAG: glycerol-3-phosphate dehydrogenase/oxidase [Alphaproteobacteria bacterium]|nr:glycerol-3-phosphate dehydrogenase/oxidase [Alphaproteobacteria bacterium]
MRRDFSALGRLSFDVLIVGGGITGACIARDAAMRGLKVALVEKKDFSHATSAANSKLVHGGLRYLQNLEFGLVRESLRERRIWQRIAPHLVYPLPFLIPQPKSRKGTLKLRLGLTLYDLLSYDRTWLDDKDQRLPAHRTVKAEELQRRAPVAIASGYPFALEYQDCQMYAPERLGLGCIQDAAERGAVVANYAEAIALTRTADGTVTGARVRDGLTGAEAVISARLTVNAAGPWADKVLAMAQDGTPSHRLIRAKGIHLITRPLTDGSAALAMFIDGGHFFVLPWRGHTIIGTTDDVFEGAPDDVAPTQADIAKMLAAVNKGLPSAKLTADDVIHAYAGVRPLIDESEPGAKGGSYKRSRKAEIIDHAEDGEANLLSALGGKWTTSRHVAAQCVDLIEKKLDHPHLRVRTDTTPLGGASTGNFAAFVRRAQKENRRVDPAVVANLARNYGARMEAVIAGTNGDARLLEPLSSALPDCAAEILYGVRNEMALMLEDVIFRRTGIGTLGSPGEAVIERCGRLMADLRGWNLEETSRQIDAVMAHFLWGRRDTA